MLHRIAWDCKLPSMLFQASLLRKFQEILQLNDPAYKELTGLAIYTVRKLIEVAAVNKKVFMELLLFKSSKEAYEIECGYGIPTENESSNPLVWEEHEEEELRRLHSEYLETNPCEDMLDWITEHLIKHRNKKIVKKKVVALGLHISVKNKKGLTTSWTEEQKEELKILYNELKNTEEDVIDKIMARIQPPRTRINIIKALVTLGLAESAKDFAKSKTTGQRKKKQNVNSSSDRESSDSDEDENVIVKTKEQIRANDCIPNLYQTVKLIFLEKELNSYIINGLEWLESCMDDCLDDIDDEQTEVPLLPLSNESILSIENVRFKDFLSSLGIFRPLQQEIYWRFPEIWKENDFKCRKKIVKLLMENESFDDCREDLKALIREIGGKELNTSSDESDNEALKLSYNIKKPSSNSDSDDSSDSAMKILKQKLLQKNRKSKTLSKSLNKKKYIKTDHNNWSSENIEEASTEDFNKLVTEQCRVLLHKEGVNLNQESNSATQSSSQFDLEGENNSLIKKRSIPLSFDSDSEDNMKPATTQRRKVSPDKEKKQFGSENSQDQSRNRVDSDDDYVCRPVKMKKTELFVESDSEDETFHLQANKSLMEQNVNCDGIEHKKEEAASASKRPRISDSEDETPPPRHKKKNKATVLSDDED